MTRTTDAQQRLLEAAEDLFYRHGIGATGVDRLVEAADVAKMTLYNNFGSKDELVAAYLARRHRAWEHRLEAHLERADSPKQRLLATFDAYLESASEPGHRGCAFLNAAAEVPQEGHPARAVVRSHKDSVRELLREQAATATVDASEELADQLFLLLEGAIVTAGVHGSAEPLQWARAAAERLIATHQS